MSTKQILKKWSFCNGISFNAEKVAINFTRRMNEITNFNWILKKRIKFRVNIQYEKTLTPNWISPKSYQILTMVQNILYWMNIL